MSNERPEHLHHWDHYDMTPVNIDKFFRIYATNQTEVYRTEATRRIREELLRMAVGVGVAHKRLLSPHALPWKSNSIKKYWRQWCHARACEAVELMKSAKALNASTDMSANAVEVRAEALIRVSMWAAKIWRTVENPPANMGFYVLDLWFSNLDNEVRIAADHARVLGAMAILHGPMAVSRAANAELTDCLWDIAGLDQWDRIRENERTHPLEYAIKHQYWGIVSLMVRLIEHVATDEELVRRGLKAVQS